MMAQSVVTEYPETMAEASEEPRLSYEENWDLIFSLFGSGKEMFAKLGGGEAFLRAERAAWTESEHE